MVRPSLALAALSMLAPLSAFPASASDLPTLRIVVFAAPSQSIWIPSIIQEAGLDRKHGFVLDVTPKPSQVAYSDFATGAERVCYCANPSAVARFVQEGSDITLLWNVFSLSSLISTTSPDIREPKDLEGRILAADTTTGSWAITNWWLQQHGVDMSKVQIQSTTTGGLFAQLSAGRVDAASTGPIAVSTLATSEGGDQFRFIALDDSEIWSRYADTDGVPSIAFGVWRDWIEDPENADLARRFYAANLDAVELIRTDPGTAADHVASRTSLAPATLLHNFKEFPQIIDVRPIGEVSDAIRVLTTDLLPSAGILPRPLTEDELDRFVSDFEP